MKTKAPSIVAPNGIDYPGGDVVERKRGVSALARPVRHRDEGPGPARSSCRTHPCYSIGPKFACTVPTGEIRRISCERLVGQLGIGRWVTIGDPVYGDEKWRLISHARACVYPSRWDACPVAVSEAAAMGVPTLVTRYPLGTFLAARGAAIQVDPDPSSIAEGIPRLMSPDSEGMGRNAATVARRHLSWDAVATSWLAQFRDLIGE